MTKLNTTSFGVVEYDSDIVQKLKEFKAYYFHGLYYAPCGISYSPISGIWLDGKYKITKDQLLKLDSY
jgi:hypothetical protein